MKRNILKTVILLGMIVFFGFISINLECNPVEQQTTSMYQLLIDDGIFNSIEAKASFVNNIRSIHRIWFLLSISTLLTAILIRISIFPKIEPLSSSKI
ncbi:hypothetical protein [uncultured Aquimarina sp.]|uniref:hypothetical protein n=1 Tax=uncultured Aquimarina sp. TaxID=575652 RepID=UPI002639C890|nr:hypothetical protein [uncultured Aquimarina sp.]